MYTLSKGLKTFLDSKRGKTEDKIEDYLVEQVEAIGGYALKVRLITGFPDRLILLPGGRVQFVELKRPKGGRFEPLQPVWIKRLKKLGFEVDVINTKQGVDTFIFWAKIC